MNIDTMHNQLSDTRETMTRASETITKEQLSDGIFIGIALSGGGSRAANFSSAILLELKKLGILDKATAISSVSGSSLPAAYYGLYPKRWNDINHIRNQMAKDYEIRWIGRWFLPQNILLYWNTNFNRSDIMKEVLDSNLFDEKTFADIGNEKGQPRILINSTTLSGGKTFVFSKEQFNELGSRIDTYPIANAVMASSAFPGAFHDMTLHDFSISDKKHYQHVLDGSPSDNLGITTLLNMVKPLYDATKKEQPCFLFVVDSYPYPKYPEHIHEADTRGPIDFIFDTNVAAASDSLLTVRRVDLLRNLNIDAKTPDIDPFKRNEEGREIKLDDGNAMQCAVWHLSLQRLLSKNFASKKIKEDDKLNGKLRENIDQVANVVNSIPTRYKLTGRDPNGKVKLSADALQDYLFKAADYLVNSDNDNEGFIRDQVCDWFKRKSKNSIICNTTP